MHVPIPAFIMETIWSIVCRMRGVNPYEPSISLLLPLPLMRYHSISRTLFLSHPSPACISRSSALRELEVFLSRVRALALAERERSIYVATRVQLNYLSRFHDARTPKISGCMRDARQKGPRANRS